MVIADAGGMKGRIVEVTYVLIGMIPALIFGLVVADAAWRNGVTDGYGFAKEPRNPGYEKAGDYLKRVMSHRWPELNDEACSRPPS